MNTELKDKKIKRNKDQGTALEKYWKSFFHAIDGIKYGIKNEHNMPIIIICIILNIVCGIVFRISHIEWLFVLLIIGFVLISEFLNSAIEAAVDLTTTSIHPLAKIAKDTASAATLCASIVAFIGGILIYVPRIVELFF